MARRALTAVLLLAFVPAPASAAGPGRDGPFLLLSGQFLDFNRDLNRNLTLWHFEKSVLRSAAGTGRAWSVGYGRKSYNGSWDILFLRPAGPSPLKTDPAPRPTRRSISTGDPFF